MRGINVVRFPSPVDPPATSQDQALHKVAIFTGSLHAGRRIDHASRDAWKAQPVELSHFQIVCCVHRSVPIAVENRNAYPDDLIPRIVNHRLRRAGRRWRRVALTLLDPRDQRQQERGVGPAHEGSGRHTPGRASTGSPPARPIQAGSDSWQNWARARCRSPTKCRPLVIKVSQTCSRLRPPAFKQPTGEIPTPPSDHIPLWPRCAFRKGISPTRQRMTIND